MIIAKNQLLKVLEKWNLIPTSCKEIVIGDSTNNWIVKTKTKKYILRAAGLHERYVAFQLFLLSELRARDFFYKIPIVVKNRFSESYIKSNKQIFFIYNFINGKILGINFTYNQAEEIGFIVGHYHKLVKSGFYRNYIRRKDIFNIDYVIKGLLKIGIKIKKKKNQKYTEIIFLENLDIMITNLKFKISKKQIDLYSKLNRVPCHSDWNGTNLIINTDGKIVGLIDFGGIHMEPKVFDFQNAILYAAFSNFHLNLTKIKKFYKGYSKDNSLTSEEISLIYPTMLADLAFTLLWIFEKKLQNDSCRIPDWDIEFRIKIFKWLIKNEKIFKEIIKNLNKISHKII